MLTLLPGLPAMANSKDVCWKVANDEVDAGTLRLRVVHSIANEHFVLNGVRELGDGPAYAVTGGAVSSGSTYKVTLLETGGGDLNVWSTSWPLDLDPQTLGGPATAITTVVDDVLDTSTEAGFFDAELVACKAKK